MKRERERKKDQTKNASQITAEDEHKEFVINQWSKCEVNEVLYFVVLVHEE